MGVPGKIPFEGKGGALGKIAKAILANRRAIDESYPIDGDTICNHGIHGELEIGRVPGTGGGATGLANSSFAAKAKQGTGQHPVVEVKMLGGTVQGLFGALQVFPTTYWTSGGGAPTLFDDYNSATDELESAIIPNGEWFWLEYTPDGEGGGEWSLEHGSEPPQSASTTDEDEVNYFAIVTLFQVRLSQPDTGVVQNHYGGVWVPAATNVVQIQEVAGGLGGA